MENDFEKPSNKAPLIGALLIVMAIVGYVFYTSNLAAEVSVMKAAASSKSEEVKVLKAKLNGLEEAESELELTTEVKRLEILKSIPTSVRQDEIIRDLIEIAKNNDIELNSISFAKNELDQENIGKVKISASFEGNYQDLIVFLEGLERNGRLFKVDSISVQLRKLDFSDFARASFSLSIETYFQK